MKYDSKLNASKEAHQQAKAEEIQTKELEVKTEIIEVSNSKPKTIGRKRLTMKDIVTSISNIFTTDDIK